MFSTRFNSLHTSKFYAQHAPLCAQKEGFSNIISFKTIPRNSAATVSRSKSNGSLAYLLRIFTSARMKKWIPPFITEENDSSYWVIRVGRSWPKPEVYGSILLPYKDTGEMERYVMAFTHKKDAISASQSYMFKNHRIFIDHVSWEYLEKGTLNSIGVAVFDDDITYLAPSKIIPKIDADDHQEHSPKIIDNLNMCFQL